MELGRVKFTYFHEEDEMMEKVVTNNRFQGRYLRWLGREFETRQKTSSNSDSSGEFNHNILLVPLPMSKDEKLLGFFFFTDL